MNTLITALAGLTTVLGWNLHWLSPSLQQQQDLATKKIEWSCEKPVWTSGPALQGGLFKGSMGTNCRVRGIDGGGFPVLEKYLHEKITTSPEVERVHSGPIARTYKDLPSSYYDVTVTMASGDDKVWIREDVDIATDSVQKLIFAAHSTKVEGEGYGKYMRRLDAVASIEATKEAGVYTYRLDNVTHVEKPWYAPGGMFKKEVIEAVEGQFKAALPGIAQELGTHL